MDKPILPIVVNALKLGISVSAMLLYMRSSSNIVVIASKPLIVVRVVVFESAKVNILSSVLPTVFKESNPLILVNFCPLSSVKPTTPPHLLSRYCRDQKGYF